MKRPLRWTSRKLWSSLGGIAILWGMCERAILLLYGFWLPEQITGVVWIIGLTFTNISVIVLGYLKYSTSAMATVALQSSINAVSSRTGTGEDIERLYKLMKLDPKDIPDADSV